MGCVGFGVVEFGVGGVEFWGVGVGGLEFGRVGVLGVEFGRVWDWRG